MTDSEYKINNGQLSKIHVLLGKLGLLKDKEYKSDMVKQYTDGRETSTTKLSWKEAQDVIADLDKLVAKPSITPEMQKGDRKRKRILYYAHQMGHELPGGKVDMDWVNGWCQEYGYLHKPLNDYSVLELSKLVWQMEQAYKDYLRAV